MSITAEIQPPKKRRVSSKAAPKHIPAPPENHADTTIETHPAPEPAAPATSSGNPPQDQPKQPYSWDRTQEESRMKMAPFPPVPGNMKKVAIGPCLDYWNGLPVALHTHATLYAQRWLPVVKPTVEVDDFGKKHITHPNCGKWYREHGPLTEEMLISKLGYGDYTFRLNDTRISMKLSRDAATVVYSELKTKRDWAEHPPVVDPKDLEMDDPANSGYITWARSRGLIPNETQQETEDMQNVQAGVADRLTSTVERLTDKVIAQAESKEKQQPPPTPPAAPPSNGDGGALRAMADVVTAALNRPQPTAAPAADPMSMVKGIADVVQTLMPKPDSSSSDLAKEVVKESAAANERVFKMQESAISELRKEIQEAKTPAPAATPTAAPAPPKTDVDLLQEMVTKQDLMKKLTGRGGSAAEEEEKPSKIDKWLEAAPILGPIVQSVVGGIFQTIQFGLQSWQTVSYNNALAKNGTTPQPPTVMNPQQQQPQPGQPAAAQGPPPTPEQQAQQQRIMIMLKALEDAANPILVAFSKDETGDSAATAAGAKFADTVISYKGRPDYDLIRSVGENPPGTFSFETFTANVKFLLNHPGRGPNTAHLAAQVAPKPSFGQFLAGFFNYDLIQAELQRQAEQEQQ